MLTKIIGITYTAIDLAVYNTASFCKCYIFMKASENKYEFFFKSKFNVQTPRIENTSNWNGA